MMMQKGSPRTVGQLAAMLLALVMLSGAPLAAHAETFPVSEGYSRMIEVPGMGPMQYYAQNDPVWANSIYEYYKSHQARTMTISGCGPTVVAMALANLLTPDELVGLLDHCRDEERGFSMCPASVNGLKHKAEEHELFYPTTGEDFLTYLPMIVAAYATGNNDRNLYYRKDGGTSVSLFRGIAACMDLGYTETKKRSEAYEMLQNGSMVITTATKGYFTSQSHYLLFVGLEDGWVYLLDPNMREIYPNDRNGHVEVLEPGLVRYREEDNDRASVYGYYIFSRKDEE